jgi:hypothetical protein
LAFQAERITVNEQMAGLSDHEAREFAEAFQAFLWVHSADALGSRDHAARDRHAILPNRRSATYAAVAALQ